MANTQNAPGAGSVSDPGGLRYPVGTAVAAGTVGGASAAPGAPAGGISRASSTLPLNSPQTQTVGAPGPWSAPAASSFPTVSTVSDPGAARFAVGVNQTIGMPADTAAPGGGDPSATGSYVPGAVQTGPAWSQANISGNPNPGALNGGGTAGAPAVFPGQTGINQVNPNANPNPGGL